MPFRVVIPARYDSSRLPGKVLLPLAGKPMLQWVHERARDSKATEVVIATDDERIAEAARGFTVTDGAAPGVAGYRLYVWIGSAPPTEFALRDAAVAIGEFASVHATRAQIPTRHPALAGAASAWLALRMIYAGGLESVYFSGNSARIALEPGDDGEDEEESPDDRGDEARDGEEGDEAGREPSRQPETERRPPA